LRSGEVFPREGLETFAIESQLYYEPIDFSLGEEGAAMEE